MIPYFEWTHIPIGPLHLKTWGMFAAAGILLGGWFASRMAARRGLDPGNFERLLFDVVVGAFVGARIFHVVFYGWDFYSKNPWEILQVWHGGLSSFGGFIGAAAVFWRSIRTPGSWKADPSAEALAKADSLTAALPLGIGIGRIGCFVNHLHPGVRSASFLAVAFPGGGRYDLGLLLALVDFAIFGFFLFLMRKPRRDGLYFALFMTVYGPIRFALDFLRVSGADLSAGALAQADARYLGLTPAQYGSAIFFLIGAFLLSRMALRKRPFRARL